MLKYLFLLSAACLAAPLCAQDAAEPDECTDGCDPVEAGLFDPVATIPDTAITVVASGLPSHRSDKGYPVRVIGDAELRSVQGPDLGRALRRLPSVTLTRNGPLGGFTGVRVRGAGAEQLLVLVDGVKVNDPSAPAGGFDFGNVAGEEIGKVELLRGSHSLIWGSDAIAGVMNLSTRTVDGVAASAEYGGASQFSGQALAGFDRGGLGASLSGGYVRARGISAAVSGTERDGLEQWNLSGRARLGLGGSWTLTADGRLAEGALEIDGYPAPLFAFADTVERQDTRQRSGRIGLEHRGDGLTLRAGLSRSVNDRDLFDEAVGGAPYYETRGRLDRAELFGSYHLTGPLEKVRIDFGADHEWSRFAAASAFSTDRGTARIASGHAVVTYDRGDLLLGAGVRRDDHSRFGEEWSFGANGAVELANDLSLRASYGEGFKAPTLFQLLSDYGNRGLRPERSRSYDVGLSFDGQAFSVGISLFRRDSRDLIDFVSCFDVAGGICTGRPFGTYDNVGRARAEGFELEAGVRPADGLRFGTVYSYVRARDRDTRLDLARRPRHALTLHGDWNVDPDWVFGTELGADLRLVSASFDDADNLVPTDGRVIVDLRASRPILMLDAVGQRTLDLFGRVENLFNNRTAEVAGYTAQGRAAYLGVRIAM